MQNSLPVKRRRIVNSSMSEDGNALLQAARLGWVSKVRYLIKQKYCDPMSSESRDEDGWTVLHWAAYNGQLKVMQCLIDECGMDPKSCRDDNLGHTPLHAAVQGGQLSVLRYLIKEKHCDPMNSDDENNWTVLHEAASNGKLKVVKCLIDELGMDPKLCRNDKGQTPLHVVGKYLRVLKYLINDKHCDPMSQDENGWTVLHEAASNGERKVIRCLIDEFGVEPKSCCDNRGQTPLHAAADCRDVNIIRYLIKEKGCDPMSRDEDGSTVLYRACFCGHLQVVKCLIDEFGVEPELCYDNRGQTPLHAAADCGDVNILRYLIKEKGCDPMSRDDDGSTALYEAALSSELKAVQFFVEECDVYIDAEMLSSILSPRIREYLNGKFPTSIVNTQEVNAALNAQPKQPLVDSTNLLLHTNGAIKLEFRDMHQISSYLHQIPDDALLHLGIALGLDYVKLQLQLKKESFLLAMLAMWLREEDDVIKLSGPPTWGSLVKALRAETVKQNGIADTIEKGCL